LRDLRRAGRARGRIWYRAAMPGVLDGIRIVDVSSGPVGGFASMVLADFGADVVKVEPPGGDRFRALAASPLWLRGKRSAVLDLNIDAQRGRLHELVRGADVLIVSGPPGRAARHGIDFESARRLQPSLVHCSITPWGERGPLAGYPGDAGVVAARSGRMLAFERQLRRQGPAYAAVPVGVHAAAQGAVQGIAAALLARARTGRAQRVETSLLQGLLPYDLIELLLVQIAERTGQKPPSLAAVGGDMPTLNYHPIRAADRWLQCGNLLEHLFLSFLDALGLLGEMLAEERFQGPPGSWDGPTIEAARDRILLRTREKSADEWMAVFRASGNVAAEPYLTPREALHHPDLVGNGDVLELDDPERGRVRMIGPIAQLRATPAAPGRPAPRVGEHTEAVIAERRVAPRLEPRDPLPDGQPLAGITIVEIATIIAAPLSTALLADLGARVIRVEPLEGDPYRNMLAGGGTAVKTTAGKQSICLDLKSDEGREIAQRLAARADVVLHNFRPGVPERLGIGYEELRARNPRLIWVALSGYGPDGPGAKRPSTHPCPGAAMGGAGYQGGAALTRPCDSLEEIRENARQLMRANESNPDPNSSVVCASAIALALFARERHGVGQPVFVNMLAANAYANGDDFLDYAGKPARPAIDAELYGPGAAYRLYRARQGWVFLAITCDAQWQRLCRIAGFGELAARYAESNERERLRDELARELEKRFAERDADAWEALLAPAGVGCVRADAQSPGAFFAHSEQLRANGFAPLAKHARFGEYRRWGPLVTVNGPAPSYGPGALGGEHTDALLAELGYSAADTARLRAARVVTSEPV
jgi:crotonobetainyl-CoA:carnitine CoA-transferase CaiB-like acyl-CoA transferase